MQIYYNLNFDNYSTESRKLTFQGEQPDEEFTEWYFENYYELMGPLFVDCNIPNYNEKGIEYSFGLIRQRDHEQSSWNDDIIVLHGDFYIRDGGGWHHVKGCMNKNKLDGPYITINYFTHECDIKQFKDGIEVNVDLNHEKIKQLSHLNNCPSGMKFKFTICNPHDNYIFLKSID